MALSASRFRVEQRAFDIVVGELGRAIPGVGHVTIRAGDARLEVGAVGSEGLIFGVLRFEHRSARIRIFPILEICIVVILDDILDLGPVCPREGQVFAVAFEVILNMAIRADHGAHLLAGERMPILPLRLQGLFQRRVGHDQFHACSLHGS